MPVSISRLVASSLATAAMFGLVAPNAMAAEAVEVLAITASSADGMLMDAVDADPSTFWQNKAGDKDAWLAVRFAEPTMLRGVRLNTGAMPAGVAVEVETSSDGVSYTSQLRDQRVRDDKPVELIFPKATSALYVRLRFRGGTARYRVNELEALGAK